MSNGPMTTLRLIIVVLLAGDVLAVAWLVGRIVWSAVGPPENDPHGFAIFGAVFLLGALVPIGLLLLLALRWTRRSPIGPTRDSRADLPPP